MSERLIPVTRDSENCPNCGSITHDSQGVLRNPDGTAWSPLSVEQAAISWKVYIVFLFGLLLLWQGYEWGWSEGLPKDTVPEIPFEDEASFVVDTETYRVISVIVNTTATIANVAILTSESQDTKSIQINSVTSADNSRKKYMSFQETRENEHYTLALNANGTAFGTITNIQIMLPSRQLNLDSLSIVLSAGRVNGSALVDSHISNLNVKVNNGTIIFKDIRGSNINLETSTGDIAGTFGVAHTYNAFSKQGNIDCRLRVPSHSTPGISIGTSIGNATARVTYTFSGSFSLFTQRGLAYVFGGQHMKLFTNTTSAKNGYFRGENADSNISMYAQKGRIILAFRRQV